MTNETSNAASLSTDPNKAETILSPFRRRIDALDVEILALLRKRIDIIEEVADVKLREGLHPVLQERVDEVRENAKRMAREHGLDEAFVGDLYAQLIQHCCDLEATLMKLDENAPAAQQA